MKWDICFSFCYIIITVIIISFLQSPNPNTLEILTLIRLVMVALCRYRIDLELQGSRFLRRMLWRSTLAMVGSTPHNTVTRSSKMAHGGSTWLRYSHGNIAFVVLKYCILYKHWPALLKFELQSMLSFQVYCIPIHKMQCYIQSVNYSISPKPESSKRLVGR